MKFLIGVALVVCLAVAVYAKPPEEFFAKLQMHKADCIKESEIDVKLVAEYEKMHTGEMKPATSDQWKQFNTKEIKNFVKCMAIKSGLVNEKGDVQYDIMAKIFDISADSDAMKHFKQCADTNRQEPDVAERIINIKQCIMMGIQDKRP